MSVAVTTHAKKRLKERCGINKQCAHRMAEKAFKEGISFDNAGELLQKYISSVYLKHDKMCNNLRIYGNTVYVFDNRTLITVYAIPKNIQDEIEYHATSIDKAADKAYFNHQETKPIINNISNRSNARKKLYEEQDGKCAFCDRPIPFERTGMIRQNDKKYCICPACNRLYSIQMNPQHTKGNAVRPKKTQKTFYPDVYFLTRKKHIDFISLTNFMQHNLNKNNIEIKHIGIKNDEVGIYIELIVDDYTKILPDHMTQLATTLGIRIKCR